MQNQETNRSVPPRALATETIIHDLKRNRAVMRIAGAVVLPVGAEVELCNPNVNAIVKRVRLLAGIPATATTPEHPVQVCLDCDIPAGWSEAQEET